MVRETETRTARVRPGRIDGVAATPVGDYLADEGQHVDSADSPNGPAIDFGAGDAGQILLCLGNRWIMGGYH